MSEIWALIWISDSYRIPREIKQIPNQQISDLPEFFKFCADFFKN